MNLIEELVLEEKEMRIEALRMALNKTQHGVADTAEILILAQQFYRFLIGYEVSL